MSDIKFNKYISRGAYHWEQISNSLVKRNVFVIARYQFVINQLAVSDHSHTVLDVGCGDGVLSYLISKKGFEVTGIDSSKEAIKFAQNKCIKKSNISLLVGTVYTLPFADKSFDNIVCSEVIEHLENPDQLLKEIKRVWNGKGKVVITTPIKLTEKPLDTMHVQEFFCKDLDTLVKKYFKTVKIVKTHPLFWTEFQNATLFGRIVPKILLNIAHIVFKTNPYFGTQWRYFSLQSVIIKGTHD